MPMDTTSKTGQEAARPSTMRPAGRGLHAGQLGGLQRTLCVCFADGGARVCHYSNIRFPLD
jgi:hypothetical protein